MSRTKKKNVLLKSLIQACVTNVKLNVLYNKILWQEAIVVVIQLSRYRIRFGKILYSWGEKEYLTGRKLSEWRGEYVTFSKYSNESEEKN